MLVGLFSCLQGFSQVDRIRSTVDSLAAEAHLRFLTSDELRGRNTGTNELLIAGRYIAEHFRKHGLIPLGDKEGDYLQKVPLVSNKPATEASVGLMGKTYQKGVDLSIVAGANGSWEAPAIFIADPSEMDSLDLEGKMVVCLIQDPRSASLSISSSALADAGAAGLIQVYGPGQRLPWAMIMNYLGQERMTIEESADKTKEAFPHVWIYDTTEIALQKWREISGTQASIDIEGMQITEVLAYNVVGKIEGSDPELRREHIIMCAHYDHVGVQTVEGQDSIFNGTRDNGIGTTGVLNAAQYFAAFPPKRSVIFIALTAEEKGLLGSTYYAEHPSIPLAETVFAFNIDNSGYTGTEHITLLDTSRTTIDPYVYQAAGEVGLQVMGDRIPSQNYFERSDQVSFARKGVPAVNFKMAMETFDERISTYYHQPNDEFHSVDLPYIHKYWITYLRSAELVANAQERPYWIEGDKFEAAGNALYDLE